MKGGLKDVLGKTLTCAIMAERKQHGPFYQVFLLFSDNTHFEIYGSSFNVAGGVDRGAKAEVLSYMKSSGTVLTAEYSTSVAPAAPVTPGVKPLPVVDLAPDQRWLNSVDTPALRAHLDAIMERRQKAANSWLGKALTWFMIIGTFIGLGAVATTAIRAPLDVKVGLAVGVVAAVLGWRHDRLWLTEQADIEAIRRVLASRT